MESTTIENYLKAVYNAREWSEEPVTVGALADRLGLAPSTASEHVRKLADRGLLTHARYGTIELTAQGQHIAVGMVRKHRLIETFLVEDLGYTWDEVHNEAEVLEHAVSETFIERLAARLGDPVRDPHGDPIPRADGTLPPDDLKRLDATEPGTLVRVVRVWDDDPDLLRTLDEAGITVGAAFTVVGRDDADGSVELDSGGRILTLDPAAASAIRVAPTAA